MKSLFLDDDENRHELFTKWLPSADRVFTYDEAATRILRNEYGILFVDHDLSVLDQMVKPGNPTVAKTGMDLAKFIVDECIRPQAIIVHSYNNYAAPIMVELFKSNGIESRWLPFGIDLKMFIELNKKELSE